MKKLILALFTISFLAFACNEADKTIAPTSNDNQEQEADLADSTLNYVDDQKALMLFYTSTGCPGCGSWGSPTFENLAKQYPDDVIPLAVHIKYGDPMITEISEAIASNRTGQYYTPQIWVNNTNIMVLNTGRIDGTASVKKAETTITNSSSSEAMVKMGNRSLINKDSSKIQIKAGIQNKGQLDEMAEYYMASYVLEDKIIANQVSSSADHEHNYVIRSSTKGSFGDKVMFENGGFEILSTVDLMKEWNAEELTVLTVLWKKVGNRYLYENSFISSPQQ